MRKSRTDPTKIREQIESKTKAPKEKRVMACGHADTVRPDTPADAVCWACMLPAASGPKT